MLASRPMEVTMRKPLPLVALLSVTALAAVAQNNRNDWKHSEIKHVLLISIDGMHAADFLNCAKGMPGVNDGEPFCPNLAELSSTGINYVAANTSKPSDSFPGLMTIV